MSPSCNNSWWTSKKRRVSFDYSTQSNETKPPLFRSFSIILSKLSFNFYLKFFFSWFRDFTWIILGYFVSNFQQKFRFTIIPFFILEHTPLYSCPSFCQFLLFLSFFFSVLFISISIFFQCENFLFNSVQFSSVQFNLNLFFESNLLLIFWIHILGHVSSLYGSAAEHGVPLRPWDLPAVRWPSRGMSNLPESHRETHRPIHLIQLILINKNPSFLYPL